MAWGNRICVSSKMFPFSNSLIIRKSTKKEAIKPCTWSPI